MTRHHVYVTKGYLIRAIMAEGVSQLLCDVTDDHEGIMLVSAAPGEVITLGCPSPDEHGRCPGHLVEAPHGPG